jgi:hypothetical protein
MVLVGLDMIKKRTGAAAMVASRLFNAGQCPHPINRKGRKDSPSAQLLSVYKWLFSFATGNQNLNRYNSGSFVHPRPATIIR